ncbi:hypothetical protein CFC21_068487 [Triticum aestivum]|uniref:Uncharacterized protein n=3 Tax=Triticum TaxID=4564 RepID=A0A9R0U2J5_TRITD|nr:uncharacterized protein LOC123108179 [Triticum aestivum]KAF7061823.1 hypothetical protein CFC21_068487 [Triticum aestivum]VAI24027.1 unnamed protein product [Triticum turgidum subsp. durum]
MDSKQQLALRPISTKRGSGGDGRAVLAREPSSLTNASFRVYYSLRAGAGAVPFLWESAPGTPKRGAAAVSPGKEARNATMATTRAGGGAADVGGGATLLLPPISPPPSYQSQLKGKKGCRQKAQSWPGGIVRALLGALCTRKRRRRSAPHPASYYGELPLHC